MDSSTLVLTQIIFRHGQRAPDVTIKYAGDPYANEKYLPFGPSELTLIGRKQCYHFGQTLRQRYGDFVGPEFYNGLLVARSSERSRAIMTLQLTLAGLFPPTPSTQVHELLNWQPIPFTYKPLNDDKLIGCAITNMYNAEDSPTFRKTQNSLDVIKCVEEDLKWPMKMQAQCFMIYDGVQTQANLGLPVPEWCAKIYPEKLQKEYRSFIEHNFGRKNFVIAACGELIQEINKMMTDKVCAIKQNEADKVPKMYLYSGHDLNLIPLLAIFKRFDVTKWPMFTANFAFELHHINGEFYVKILYQDGPTDPANFTEDVKIEEIALPNSSDIFSKLNDFTTYVLDYFPNS